MRESPGHPWKFRVSRWSPDVGHMLAPTSHDMAGLGRDDRHEQVGAAWLARFFGPDVTGPIRHHVDGRRFLAAVHTGYVAALSPSSLMELDAQGGPMGTAEA